MKLIETPRESVACFTGHRSIAREREAWLYGQTEAAVRTLISRGYDTFVSGGALGFDTLAHRVVLRLREEFPYIRSVLAIPCRNQDARWNSASRELYARLVAAADEAIVLSETYSEGCMQIRNRFMVDRASVCVAYYDGHSGGTANTVQYAARCGVPVMNLYR